MGAPIGNLFALGNKGGRPAFFDTPEELKKRIVEYFESYLPKKDGNPPDPALGFKPTVSGLGLWLGFSDRRSFYNYADRKKDKEEFAHIVKKAIYYIEMQYEQLLESKGATGAIFALKNMGWKDKIEQEVTTNQSIVWHEEKTYEANEEADTSS